MRGHRSRLRRYPREPGAPSVCDGRSCYRRDRHARLHHPRQHRRRRSRSTARERSRVRQGTALRRISRRGSGRAAPDRFELVRRTERGRFRPGSPFGALQLYRDGSHALRERRSRTAGAHHSASTGNSADRRDRSLHRCAGGRAGAAGRRACSIAGPTRGCHGTHQPCTRVDDARDRCGLHRRLDEQRPARYATHAIRLRTGRTAAAHPRPRPPQNTYALHCHYLLCNHCRRTGAVRHLCQARRRCGAHLCRAVWSRLCRRVGSGATRSRGGRHTAQLALAEASGRDRHRQHVAGHRSRRANRNCRPAGSRGGQRGGLRSLDTLDRRASLTESTRADEVTRQSTVHRKGQASMRKMAPAATTLLLIAQSVHAQGDPTESRFRGLYKELVETNTTLSAGDCTLAAARMAARLKAAGFTDAELHPFAAPDHPKEGGLVAIYQGRDPQLKAILLLAHIDVVEAKREDWERDPFKLVEENGNFYARGSVDDKAQAAIWVDTLIRLRAQKYRPLRTLKLALTCGEETAGAFNGAQWLTQNRRELIDAAFAINEGANGELDAAGNRVLLQIQAGEKFAQNYQLEVTNRGGHSSRPVKDNAIYRLAAALKRIEAYEFPAMFADGNRAYFQGMAKIEAAKGDTEIAAAMTAFLKDPQDEKALALVSARDPTWNATLRTTCVATMLNAGHATNALPQRATAVINCRIFPGVTAAQVRSKLEELVADPEVKVTRSEE